MRCSYVEAMGNSPRLAGLSSNVASVAMRMAASSRGAAHQERGTRDDETEVGLVGRCISWKAARSSERCQSGKAA